MLTAGDEFGRTQGGNNNAYAQDNETTWLDWENRNTKLEAQFAELMQLRNKLSDVICDDFLNGNNVQWFAGDGNPLDWSKDNNRIIAMVLRSTTRRICVFFNATSTATTLRKS